jgi:hypothetical protein
MMKLTLGSIIRKTLDNGNELELEIIGITLVTDKSMPFVSVVMSRYESNTNVVQMTTVFDELVRWINEPGWKVVR